MMRSHGFRLTHIVVCIAAVVVVSNAMLFNEFHGLSSDAGQHYAIIRQLMDMQGWIRPTSPYLGPLQSYPPAAHWIAAEIGKLLDSGLLGMTVVATTSVALFYLALFTLSFDSGRKIALYACCFLVVLAFLRAPIFGRQIVNNYFYSQVVGSSIGIWAFLVVFYARDKVSPVIQDVWIILVGQLLVATHLTAAAQLMAAYGTFLALQAWGGLNRTSIARLIFFTVVASALTAFNPYARYLTSVAQQGGGAHVNLLLGHQAAQFALFTLGGFASLRLLTKENEGRDTHILLALLGLSACLLALLQLFLSWINIGSAYAVEKHIFVTLTLLVFILSANISLGEKSDHIRNDGWVPSIVICSALSLVATRADLYPSVLNLREVVAFQRSVRELRRREPIDSSREIVFSTLWPRNVSYMLSLGDLKVPFAVANNLLGRAPGDLSFAQYVLMPPSDPLLVRDCDAPEASNESVSAMRFSCFLAAGRMNGAPPN
ncbi:hypothetical protein [uncultured Bradyrhizobium sp.]|jgi:hypothetical protein|uniref:hypothetical protein n=1 Tax=uncultured Bradyrhizobium sp. TaxID=199684 RepID=UPI0026026375|nr:hypothetical protein [uncultured Bradyrhizobium sp.]